MMKRVLWVCVAVCMLLCIGTAFAEESEAAPVLDRAEVNDYIAQQLPLFGGDDTILLFTSEGSAWYAASRTDAVLVCDENEALSDVRDDVCFFVAEGEDLRGVAVGASIDSVFSAYPNYNPSLTGSELMAPLYVQYNEAGNEMDAGILIRASQQVQQVAYEHIVLFDDETAEVTAIVYNISDERVSGILIQRYTEDALTVRMMMEEIQDALSFPDFTPVPTSSDGRSLKRFCREDLIFDGLDFLDVTPELAAAFFGTPLADNTLQDGDNALRVMEWENLRIVFDCDADGKMDYIAGFVITGEGLRGPRGIQWGDSVDSVLHRFYFEETQGALYGTEEDAAYGTLFTRDNGTTIKYAVRVDERLITLNVDFVNGNVSEILISQK